MTWKDLADDELASRLAERGMLPAEIDVVLRHRDDERVERAVREFLGEDD